MRAHPMRTAAAAGLAALILLVPTPATASSGPVAGAAPSAALARADGDFLASVDFTSLQARDVRGSRCELTVQGVLTFTGSVEGTADGTTTALVLAPCVDVLAREPGTYADVFRFSGEFAGEVLGRPASGRVGYSGLTRVGGRIDAAIVLTGDDVRAVLRADARVAVGGTYRGIIVPL